MTGEEELQQLRAENTALREALQRKDEELQQSSKANQDLREGLKQAIVAMRSLQEQVKATDRTDRLLAGTSQSPRRKAR